MRDPIRFTLWSLAGLIAAITALSFGDRFGFGGVPGWIFDLLSHWPRHLALAGIIVGAIAFWRRVHAAGVTALAAGAINLALLIGVGGFADPQAAPENARLLRIASANVHRSMPALEKFVALTRDYNADIIALYEVPDDLTDEQFNALFPDHPTRMLLSKRDNGWPLIRRSALAVRSAPIIISTMYEGSHGVLLSADTMGVNIVTTHPPSPGDPGLKADRDRQLSDIAAIVEGPSPFIIAGDFNSTPWGRAYASVPGTRAGDPRFAGTFPTFLGPLALPIDHIKFGGLTLTDYRTGPDIGSDHLPLFATFALPEN